MASITNRSFFTQVVEVFLAALSWTTFELFL
jgi:hypothetical protein